KSRQMSCRHPRFHRAAKKSRSLPLAKSHYSPRRLQPRTKRRFGSSCVNSAIKKFTKRFGASDAGTGIGVHRKDCSLYWSKGKPVEQLNLLSNNKHGTKRLLCRGGIQDSSPVRRFTICGR